METVHDVLTRTYNILEQRGWCRTRLQSGGHVCLLGALDIATGGEAARLEADDNHNIDPYSVFDKGLCREALVVLDCPSKYYSSPVTRTFDWNDAQESAEPVKARLLSAIAATAPAPADPFPSELPDLTPAI